MPATPATMLMLLWVVLPVVAFTANRLRRKPWHPAGLYVVTGITGYLLLLAVAYVADVELRAKMDSFDVDGDGGIGGAELTPEAQQAMDAWASDTGRTMVMFTGVPLSAIWYGIVFCALYAGECIIGKLLHARRSAAG